MDPDPKCQAGHPHVRNWPAAPAPGDLVLALMALLLAAWLALDDADPGQVQSIVIEVDGTVISSLVVSGLAVSNSPGSEFSAASDTTIRVTGIAGISTIRIAHDSDARLRARFETAPCRGQICVAQGWLQRAGDVAACVPNRMVLRLTGTTAPALDGVTR